MSSIRSTGLAAASLLVTADAFTAPTGRAELRTLERSTTADVQLLEDAAGVADSASSRPASLAAATALTVGAAGALTRRAMAGRAKASVNRSERRLVSVAAFESELGIQAPVGFFDPLGLSKDGDIGAFKRRRATELKHGRVSMLACMGYIVPEYLKFPGYLAPKEGLLFADVPNGLAAISKVPAAGVTQWVAFLGALELNVLAADPSRDAGDFENAGKLGLPFASGIEDAEKRKRSLNAELANGRLAMMAITGMFFQDGLTGSAWGDWSLYTDSPLRAFENELGVQAPTGFWDPLGYCADGSAVNFRRRRESELKHGRIAMLAAMGYITPEYFKFPGYLAPHLYLKFADVPNGLAALTKVPEAGWAQYAFFVGLVEVGFLKQDPARAPGDFANGGTLGVPNAGGPIEDEEARKRKLNSELANGRLAMMAIIGMFFQDGLTGSAWGDWSLFTSSPLRFFGGDSGSYSSYKAFDPATELGVQEPLGFWDPLGFTSDGDQAAFLRRRSVELKHGRVAMAATMGYIAPYYFKFPGFLSPSAGVKFEDVPSGLAAISKVPALGWVQIIFFTGIVEGAFGVTDDYKNGTPGDYGWKVLTSSDPAEKEKKLAAELANGRLAMMAIIGMFFQDGLTGSAWGDWALYTASPLRAFENELGVQDPVGFWDPLGFTADGDLLTFKRRRCVELKHGRISMLATMGYITPEVAGKFPGYLAPSMDLKFADIPTGLAAVSKVPALGWVQMVAYAAYCELSGPRTRAANAADYADITPGDYGFKVLTSSDPSELTKKLNAEIANGRLAMMAIIGMFFQDGLTGSAWGDWALYTASPLRAFENELGVQEPVGFWDPLGFTSDGDVTSFKRRRTVELKHGRISMLATMGYITPEVTGKFPGYLSNSAALKFTDVPNGLAAISKVPALGWAQVVAYCGFVELSAGSDDWKTGTPGDYGFKVLTSSDPAEKEKKLAAELANGRLAMMAIIGMFFQDGLTGSAWGDWALFDASPLR